MKVSILTVNYNNAEGLRRTLESVAAQTYQEFEHVIIDGGSSDESVGIIRNYEKSLKSNDKYKMTNVQWISEPDNGIYDAMNKGVEIASGVRLVNALNRSELVEDKNKELPEYLLFLNGGDTLASEKALEEIAPYLDGDDFIVGRVFFSIKGNRVSVSPLLSEKDMSMYYMYLHGINHQSAFIKSELLVDMPYDTTVKMNADWLFFVQQIVMRNATVKFVDKYIADFDRTGLSSNTQAVVEERKEVLKKILPARMCRDYDHVIPHYYEVIRVEWLLRHPFWYKLYRGLTTIGRKITKS